MPLGGYPCTRVRVAASFACSACPCEVPCRSGAFAPEFVSRPPLSDARSARVTYPATVPAFLSIWPWDVLLSTVASCFFAASLECSIISYNAARGTGGVELLHHKSSLPGARRCAGVWAVSSSLHHKSPLHPARFSTASGLECPCNFISVWPGAPFIHLQLLFLAAARFSTCSPASSREFLQWLFLVAASFYPFTCIVS